MQRRDFLLSTAATLASGTLLPRFGDAAEGDNRWEATPASQQAAKRGLEWLAKSQGVTGNWASNDLGLVSLGLLAFLSAGYAPGLSSRYGENVKRTLDFILSNAKPSGLLNMSTTQSDMYNHGLSVFTLSQCYGVSNDKRLGPTLEKGLKLICGTQAPDGGWDYKASHRSRGHDLSLTVMQAKALRAAMDMGLEVPPDVIKRAIAYVRRCFVEIKKGEGAFTYDGKSIKKDAEAIAMAACGSVCLQEFGQYDDERITQSLNLATERFRKHLKLSDGRLPVNAYAMFYLAQGLYQVGGELWRQNYPQVRDSIVKTQAKEGSWEGSYRSGLPGKLFGTAVGVFALSIPNRYLPILQRGRNEKTLGRLQ